MALNCLIEVIRSGLGSPKKKLATKPIISTLW